MDKIAYLRPHSRAVSDRVAIGRDSKVLFCRAFLRRAGVHLVGKRSSHAGMERLLLDVEQAIATDAYFGDRRAVIRQLTTDLHCSRAMLQSAIAELKTWESDYDPEIAQKIRLGEDICDALLNQLGPLLQQTDHLNALLTLRDDREAHHLGNPVGGSIGCNEASARAIGRWGGVDCR